MGAALLPGEPCDSRAQMALRRIVERLDERVALERGLHDPALHAAAPAVNQPHLAQARQTGSQ